MKESYRHLRRHVVPLREICIEQKQLDTEKHTTRSKDTHTLPVSEPIPSQINLTI